MPNKFDHLRREYSGRIQSWWWSTGPHVYLPVPEHLADAVQKFINAQQDTEEDLTEAQLVKRRLWREKQARYRIKKKSVTASQPL